jgi:methyl-accepting chemotaxis protein
LGSDVRALRSVAAAREIKNLIGDSSGKVEVGTGLVSEAGIACAKIVKAVRVTDILHKTSAASIAESTGIEQMNQAIAQLDVAIWQYATLVEEAAAAAASL